MGVFLSIQWIQEIHEFKDKMVNLGLSCHPLILFILLKLLFTFTWVINYIVLVAFRFLICLPAKEIQRQNNWISNLARHAIISPIEGALIAKNSSWQFPKPKGNFTRSRLAITFLSLPHFIKSDFWYPLWEYFSLFYLNLSFNPLRRRRFLLFPLSLFPFTLAGNFPKGAEEALRASFYENYSSLMFSSSEPVPLSLLWLGIRANPPHSYLITNL